MRIAVLLFAACLLAGCATPELDRYGAGTTFSPERHPDSVANNKPSVQLYAYSPAAPPEPKDSKTKLKDLSDQGQAAFITGAFEATDGETAKVAALAGAALGGRKEEQATFALNAAAQRKLDRTLVVDISKGADFKPGDRISWAVVTIEPIGVEFTGYSIAATKYEMLNVASIEDTTSVKANASVDPTFTSDLQGKGAFGLVFGRDRKVKSDVAERYTDLSVGLEPTALRVAREGERNRDVSGNVFIALSLDYSKLLLPAHHPDEGFLVSDLKVLKGAEALTQQKASAAFSFVQYPQACPLKAKVTFAYELRRAGDNGRTYVEGDDKAEYERDTTVTTNVLVRGDDLRPRLWRITTRVEGQTAILYGAGPLGFTQPLLFASFEDARLFAAWMKSQKAGGIGADGMTFQLLSETLRADAYPMLSPEPFFGNCPTEQ